MRIPVFAALFASVGACAAPITINNASFESPVVASFISGSPQDWSLSGSGGGVWNITDSPLGFWSVGAPDGRQVAWLAPGGTTSSAAIQQSLGASLTDATLYTLTGFVGHPTGVGSTIGTTFTASLLVGGDVVASVTGTGPESSFTTFSLVFDSTGSPFIGGALGVRLESSQQQTAFDAIALDASPVPTPGAATLLAMAGLIVSMRRR